MLREVLSAELRRERPDEVPVLLGRAARWHAARGEAVEAVGRGRRPATGTSACTSWPR